MKKILIIDDEKSLCIMLETVLSNAGYKVFSAYNGKDGLESMYTVSPDLIILDIMMPGMNGYEVCKIIRNDELYKNIPILILSGQATEKGDKLKGYGMGADSYLEKPIDAYELVARVKTVLSLSK